MRDRVAGVRRGWILALACAALVAMGGAAQAWPSGRPTVSLDGVWQFRFDPTDGGEEEALAGAPGRWAGTGPGGTVGRAGARDRGAARGPGGTVGRAGAQDRGAAGGPGGTVGRAGAQDRGAAGGPGGTVGRAGVTGGGDGRDREAELAAGLELMVGGVAAGRAGQRAATAGGEWGAIRVPGCWEAQGVGSGTERMRSSAIGVGWYRREFGVPEAWRGRRVWLVVGGAHRSARVWVNGRLAGEHRGYPTAFRFEITRLLVGSGEQQLVIAVDSRRHRETDTLTGAFDLIDYMDVDWGGLFESVNLEATGDAWIADAFVQPDPAGRRAHAAVELAGGSADGLTLDYRVDPWRNPLDGFVHGRRRAAYCSGSTAAGRGGALELPLKGAPLWTPESPALLTLTLTLRRGAVEVDERVVRFGLRRLEVRGADFWLNGERFFLRGYGDDWTLPLEIANLKDRSAWVAYLARRKAFGFNGVRHHSTMPPETYLDAADEVGMLVQPELPIAYEPFFAAATPAGHALYRAVWSDYIRQMRNHPSVFAWCMGNEQYNGFLLGAELYRAAKALDPTRPVIDTDGLPAGADRPSLDYLSVQFDEWSIPWGRRVDKHRMAKRAAKPVLVHEMGNLSTLPDPADIRKYTGAVKPFWLEEMAAAVRARGVARALPAMIQASRRLQASLLKLNIESARLSPDVDGHHQWLFRDYWTQSTGIVNQFDEARALSPAEARRFIAPAALLWDRDRAGFRSGESVALRVYLSDFRPRAAGRADRVTVGCAGRTVTLRPPKGAGGRGLIGPWTGALRLPACAAPTELAITARAGSLANAWRVRVFPAPGCGPVRGVVLARRLTGSLIDRLEAGAAVLLTDASAFPTIAARFKPAWWKGDEATDHTYGNLFAAHPALAGYPGGYGDLEAAAMLEDRQVALLDDVPGRPDPIIACIDVPWRMRRKAYLFEARVGRGRLLVSALNLSAALRRSDPAAAWLRDRLVRYAAGPAFRPTATIPAAWLRERASRDALPDPAGWVEGFSRLLSASEGPQPWYSYREDHAPTYPVRQTDGKQSVRWMTAPAPTAGGDGAVTFAWAGGIGWVSEPPGGPFALQIDGAPTLEFTHTMTSTAWRTADGQVTLRYVVSRVVGPDSFGVFLLTLAADRVRPGQPLALSVTAPAGGSKRWFSLMPYRDVAAWERAE